VSAQEERSAASAQKSATLIEDAADRTKTTFAGVVRSLVFNPDDNRARLEAELYDGSGALALVWLGRRRIAGIAPGTRMSVTGTVMMDQGRPVMYNPRYELKAKTGEI
jgi:RecG-like helicase